MSNTNTSDIGFRIRKLRRSFLDVTQEDMAKKIGVTRTAISNYENGENMPSVGVLKLISDAYNVRMEWLKNGVGEPFRDTDREEEIAHFLGTIIADDDDSLKKRLVSLLAKLDESDWIAMEEKLNYLLGK